MALRPPGDESAPSRGWHGPAEGQVVLWPQLVAKPTLG